MEPQLLIMGKLIVVVGCTGVGKTSLVHALCKHGPFIAAMEEHDQRPYQQVFMADKRYALSNQLDYLLFRAEQEWFLRKLPQPGLMDGGLEMDFHGFTRLFHLKSWLTDSEFELCKRLYELVRIHQPAPELIIHLTANPEVVEGRLATRKRINIARSEDNPQLDSLINEWLSTLPPDHRIRLDVSNHDIGFRKSLPIIQYSLRV